MHSIISFLLTISLLFIICIKSQTLYNINTNENTVNHLYKLKDEDTYQHNHHLVRSNIKHHNQSNYRDQLSNYSFNKNEVNTYDSYQYFTLVPVHMSDIYKGIRYSLYNEVALNKHLFPHHLQALSSYFSVLHQYLPFDNENPRRFVKRMNQWLKGKVNDTITIKKFLAAMKVGSEGYLPIIDNYTSCSKSSSDYHCSMWLLFHILTVSEYKQKSKKFNEESPKVLIAMRSYVKNFFQCEECSKNFTLLASYLENQLNDPKSSVKWLWKTHNLINSRLNSPSNPKPQFPTSKMCPKCYIENSGWNHDEVFNFILNQYQSENIIWYNNGYRCTIELIILLIFMGVGSIGVKWVY